MGITIATSSTTLVLHSYIGSNVESSFNEALNIREILNVDVTIKFDGFSIRINSQSNMTDLQTEYRNKHHSKIAKHFG